MTEKLEKIPFRFLPGDFDVTDGNAVQEFLKGLLETVPRSAYDLETLLLKVSDLQKALSDELSWRYVRMTVHADDESYADAYNEFFANVFAPTEPLLFEIRKFYYGNPHRHELPPADYEHLNRIVAKDIELFREENVPLKVSESELANKYGAMVSKMTATFDGEEQTVAQLSVHMKDPDRERREKAWRLRMGCFAAKEEELDTLFDELRALRINIAANAGFENYRDYMHAEMGRFSYTPQDLYRFHDAVEKVVVPFVSELDEHRRQTLKLDALKPWDTVVDLDGRKLKPFEETREFIDKAVEVLSRVRPDFGHQLKLMENSGMLDLENRKGKAPGGYNTSIYSLGSSFIFMNHVKLHNDVVTLLHESGHAMHSAAMKNIGLAPYCETPSEVAELASMAMELLTMDHWDVYYSDPAELKKAKRDQLEGTLSFLPWCMMVDAFQHWVYLHPQHTVQDRREAFLDLSKRFMPSVDWSGIEPLRHLRWMLQLHIFEVPFYYIEYGMAQLGALSIYKNYRQNGASAIDAYQDFLKLGYTKPVRELYQAAGIEFDFSEQRIRALVDFVRDELATQ
jgi:oligoendopeptidase F